MVGLACSGPASAAQAPEPTPIILISIDTLRADHLSAYGYTKIHTPHIDSFAEDGTLFTRVEAQIPLTLPSHTSLFTSTYPFQNRIEENGERVPSGVTTLAAVLRAHGYRTAAFIGSDFLDQRFGLDQGFDLYDSPFNLEAAERSNPFTMTLRRDGALVVRAARQWLESNRGQAVFAFVHLYDLHVPYTLPESAARARGISRYDAELVYVDEVLGRFQQALKAGGWWDKSLVVLLSDHGEGLGDHRETDHGYFIYESTLWVPLMLHWPAGVSSYPGSTGAPAGLIDVAPTILDFLHVPAPPSFVGKSQLGGLKSGDAGGTTAVYSESLYAYDAFHWAPLRSLRQGKYKFIAAPKAELYDLEADPREQTNLLRPRSAVAADLNNQLHELLARYASTASAPPPAISPETLARLESLGYVAAAPPTHGNTSGPDPKDRLAEFQLYQAALLALEEGHPSAALPKFLELLREDPPNTLARYHLGECYLATKQPAAALREWMAVLKRDPNYAPAAEALGQYWLDQGDYAKARLRFQQVLALNPESYTGEFQLAIADEHLGMFQEAATHLEAACKMAPHDEKCARALKELRQK
jgi:arylsulfatase A-like enzyme